MTISVSEAGRRIADEIEKNGHRQAKFRDADGEDKCCVYVNTVLNPTGCVGAEWGAYVDLWDRVRIAVIAKAGISISAFGGESRAVFDWNDSTPTAEVLRVLRSL